VKRLVERYASVRPHEIDYTALLLDTNVFGRGKFLIPDSEARSRLATLLSEAEALLDLSAAFRLLVGGELCSPDDMKVSCELEYWAFFKPNQFRRVLYVGSGACPTIVLYTLPKQPAIVFDAVDISPQATVLCSQIAAKLGHQDRIQPFTQDALEMSPDRIRTYDGFFVSSAVRPKNTIIRHLLKHKRQAAKIYAREDVSHPDFYELVEIADPDLLTARQARDLWERETGAPYPLPRGCELDPVD
jgi:hypothetical protein